MFGKLKSGWSSAVDAARLGLDKATTATSSWGRGGKQKQQERKKEQANAKGLGARESVDGRPVNRSSGVLAHGSLIAGPAPAPSSASSRLSSTPPHASDGSTGGASSPSVPSSIYSFGSKLATGIKEQLGRGSGSSSTRAAGSTSTFATATSHTSYPLNGKKSSREEEREQRTFLIPPTSPSNNMDGDDTMVPSRHVKKSSSGVDAFSFEDDEEEGENDDLHLSSPTDASYSAVEVKKTRSELFESSAHRASAGAASVAAAASIASPAASSSLRMNGVGPSLSASIAASSSAAAAFSSLPRLHISGTPSFSAPGIADPGGGGGRGSAMGMGVDDFSSSPSVPSHSVFSSRVESLTSVSAQEDALLDDMAHSVARLAQLSTDVSKELHTSAQLLDELDEEVEIGASALERVNAKMRRMVKRGDRGHLKIIACLILLILFLLFLIIYT